MWGGFVGGLCFFAFLISSGINGHNIFSSHYLRPGFHINLPSIRSNPLFISGKFKRDTSSHEDTSQQTNTYTDRKDNLAGRSSSDSIADTAESLGELPHGSRSENTGSDTTGIPSSPYSHSSLRTSPALEYSVENENVEEIKYGYLSSKSGENDVDDESEVQRAAYAQAIANAQALSNTGNSVYGSTPNVYPGTSTYSALAQALANANSGQIPYRYPSWKSSDNDEDNESEAERAAYAKALANSQGTANAQALSGIGNSAYGLGQTPYMYPGSSTSSTFAKALANANVRQIPYSYSSWKSAENEEENESEAERAAYAKALANSQGIGNGQTLPGRGNNAYGLGPTPYIHSGPSTSSALAQALANSNVRQIPYSYPSWKSAENEEGNEPEAERAAYAQAIANAQALGNAQAISNTDNSYYGARPSLYSSPSSSSSTALAHALANAGGASPYGYINWRSGDIVENEADRESLQPLAAAELQASIGIDKNGQPDPIFAPAETVRSLETDPSGNIENIGRYVDNPEKELDDDEESSRVAGAYSFPNAFAGAVSRVVSQNELIIPNISPGSPQVVQCSRLYEIHVVQSPIYNCMICVCVKELFYLRPICASCNLCQQTPLLPQPEIVLPIPSPSPPLPVPQVSCDPLPTESPFQNPLNPCQICICKRTFNVFGQPDVQIQCDDNPQCITQPDIIPIPPIPVPPYIPQPDQVPLCERFPLGEPFPHPIDGCKICKCVAEPFILEKRIICIPNPECDLPAPQPLPLPPLPPLSPFEPEPLPIPRPDKVPVFPPILPPEPQEIVPVPWPPIVPSRPRPRSPLPGPPPHETCRPYPPNTPFQHPWDECQICECVEIRGLNVVNIEVNCYTKPSCCVEPPIPEPLPGPLPLPGPPGPYRPRQKILTLDPICEFQSLNVDFINPSDSCKVCTCQIYGNMIVPVCRPTNAIGSPYGNVVYIEPRCRYRQPYQQFLVKCNLCYCEEVFQYVLAKCTPQPNCDAPYLTSFGSGNANVLAQAQAQANSDSYLLGPPAASSSAEAYANALSNTGNEYPYAGLSDYSSAVAQANAQSGTSPYLNSYPYSLGGSQSSAQANAQAIANSQSLGQSPYGNYPYSMGSGQSQAQAIANAQSGDLYGKYPYFSGGSSQSSAQAQAEAIANSQSSLGPLAQYIDLSPYGNVYPYSSLGGSQSSAQAQAEALVNAQSSAYPNGYQYYPGGALSSSQAQAEAIANAQSGGWYSNPYANYPYYPGSNQAISQAEAQTIAASELYPNLYPSPGTNVLPLYQPGINTWDGLSQGQSYSQALSSANAQGLGQSDALSQALAQGSASAQSLAQASAVSGRPLIKSGSDGSEDDSSTSEE